MDVQQSCHAGIYCTTCDPREVMDEQRRKKRLMGKKFSVQSAGGDALRPKEMLQTEVRDDQHQGQGI